MSRALLLHRADSGIRAEVAEVSDDQLPAGDLLVDVQCSSLNYKDGLAVTGRGKIIRGDFPFVPGIDLAGNVVADASGEYQPGEAVILTGWGTGEERWGGFAQRARASAKHVVPLPTGLSLDQSMVIGTAGFTAMLAVMALEEHGLSPDAGDVVVTGASGGAGSIAVALLAARGFQVVASTGTEEAHDFLLGLGASRVIHRDELGSGPARPMERGRWAGAIDAVGGDTLAAIIAQLNAHASVASFGMAQSHELHTTVFPFILRGVNLLGIDSNTCPMPRRREAWTRLAETLTDDHFARIHSETIGLHQVLDWSDRITRGRTLGRVVVDPHAA